MERKGDLSKLVHHSDRGVQYLSIRYSERLADIEAAASVGSKATALTTPWLNPPTACTRPSASGTTAR